MAPQLCRISDKAASPLVEALFDRTAAAKVRSFSMPFATQGSSGNKLLANLPPQDGAYLASISRLAHPPQGQTLTNRFTTGTDIWFPHAGVVALTATDAAGRSVQTALVGREGCVGLEALFDQAPALPDSIVQIDGSMSVISAPQLRSALLNRPSVQAEMCRFLFHLSAQAMQTTACNRLHGLLARCCRWLLTFRDHVGSDDLTLTQENLATLLGSGRPRINGLLATLESNGLVRRQRGRIHLLIRSGLEQHSCDCYRIIRNVYASLDLRPT